MNRIAYCTAHARNVISVGRFGFSNKKHPIVCIGGKCRFVHDVAYEAFYPGKYDAKMSDEMICHKTDDKLDFRPDNLYIGNRSSNGIDAHDNGLYDDKKTKRTKCISFIDGDFERQYKSMSDAARYLKDIGFTKATVSGIRASILAFKKGETIERYNRNWVSIECDEII